jgi:hypothetical protein
MAITNHVSMTDLTKAGNAKVAYLWWQEKGLSFTRSDYGNKVPTPYMVRLPGSPRWRRVYCCIWSNSGTCYVSDKEGNWTVVRD